MSPDLAPISPLLPIGAKDAVAKFLVDMRLTSERSWRTWNKVLVEALVECALPLQARRVILDLNPIEDCFFAAMVALQACRIRALYPFSVAEALMRELALQIDEAVGRSDSATSNLAFIILGRIRRARQADNFCDHDQAVEALLERIGVGRNSATAAIMESLPIRHRLAEPLALAAPMWWDSFVAIYAVDAPVLKPLPRRVDAPLPPGVGERWRGAVRTTQVPPAGAFSFAAWLKDAAPNPDDIRSD
ncbi:MAG: hypothetical protein ACYCZX_04290 [Rhodospirillaceae bacterium]